MEKIFSFAAVILNLFQDPNEIPNQVRDDNKRVQDDVKSRNAETLIEAVISISVLMIIIGPASALLTSSIRNTAQNRNDLIASSLAKEGLEIMTNIIDTNLLRFSEKGNLCWNTIPDSNESACETQTIGNDTIPNDWKYYAIKFDVLNFRWQLDEVLTPLDLSDGEDSDYKIRLDEPMTPTSLNCGEPLPVGCTHMYFSPIPAGRGIETRFYRSIAIRYIPLGVSALGTRLPGMNIISSVQYRIGASVKTTIRTITLTNNPK